MRSLRIVCRPERHADEKLIRGCRQRRVTDVLPAGVSTTPGDWDSGSIALAVSLRRCRTMLYTPSDIFRFIIMLLSLHPFGLGKVFASRSYALNLV